MSATNGQDTPAAAFRPEELPLVLAKLTATDVAQKIEAATQLRKWLSLESNPPINHVIAAGAVPHLVQILANENMPPLLLFEVGWAVTNIVSGSSDHVRVVLNAGAVPPLVHLLSSPSDDVREQVIWALGNIAGDSALCRDYVLQSGALAPLLQNLVDSHKLSLLRNGTWTLSNLCRGKPKPNFDVLRCALPVLARLIYSTDEEVLTDACWALSYLSDGPNEHIQAMIDTGPTRRLIELLTHGSPSVQTPALRTVGNIVTGDDTQTQYALNCGLLPCLPNLMRHPKKSLRKEACWVISNVTAGNSAQIQTVIDANLIPPLTQLLMQGDLDVKKEAAWALHNATSGGTPEQIEYLVGQGCINAMCSLFTVTGVAGDDLNRRVMVALETLENILKVGAQVAQAGGENAYVQLVANAGGLGPISQLSQASSSEEVQAKAAEILSTFFDGATIVSTMVGGRATGSTVLAVDDDEDAAMEDAVPTGNPFTFGTLRAALQ